jgi:hypothetical protein
MRPVMRAPAERTLLPTATGEYRKSVLYQADDVLDLLEHGTEVTR